MKNSFVRSLLFAGAGAIAALPVCFSQLSMLAFFSFIPLLCLLFSEMADTARFRPRHYYATGLIITVPYFMVIFHWFVCLWPLDFVSGMTPAMAAVVIIAACIGLPLLQGLGFSFLFWILCHLSRSKAVRRAPLSLPFLFAALWTLFAYTQTLTWAGVPWGAQIALSQHENLLFLSSASFFGSYFVTFVILSVNACLAYAILQKNKYRMRLAAGMACAVFLCNFALSAVAYALPVTEERRMTVAVLQGNIALANTWDEDVDAVSIYAKLAREAAEEGAELMVWPETAIPGYLTAYNGYILERVRAIAAETNAVQIVGAYSSDRDEEGEPIRYNSLFLIYPDGKVSEHIYHKRHPVPFGEYLPMADLIRALIPPLAELDLMQDGLGVTAGKDPMLFDEPFGCIGGLICFDSIYEELTRESVAAGAEIIALGTNDSWFFDSASVYMHHAQAVLRAVENGRYVLRAANTGISSIISAKGEVLESLPPLVRGQVTCEVAFHPSLTLYTQIGDVFVLLCQLFILFPPAYALFTRRRSKRKEDISS